MAMSSLKHQLTVISVMCMHNVDVFSLNEDVRQSCFAMQYSSCLLSQDLQRKFLQFRKRKRSLFFKCSIADTVKLQIFVRYPFSYFDLKLVRTNLFSYFRGPQNKITLKFDGLKTKINFCPILNFALFSKVRKYEIKYRTKICDFTVTASSSSG